MATPTQQYIQLMTKRYHLCLKRLSRTEEVDDHPLEQIQELEHPEFMARFGPSRQRTEFATGRGRAKRDRFGGSSAALERLWEDGNDDGERRRLVYRLERKPGPRNLDGQAP